VTALAEVEPVPFWYVVEDASSTVTFWPADVDMVKLDMDMLPTVPAAPPAAGPDRALDPPPPAAVGEGDVAVTEDVPQAADSPITADVSAAAMIHRLLPFNSNRPPLDGVAAWPWLPRPTSLAKTLAWEAAQRRRSLNFQQPAALTSRSKRGEWERCLAGLSGRNRSSWRSS
jgi:hypothetical protein